MRRRGFLLAFGAMVVAREAGAQTPGRVRRIGVLLGGKAGPETLKAVDVMRAQMRERGWIEGKHIVYELRWAEGDYQRYPAMAEELVRLKCDLIVAPSADAALAAKNATAAIPIVTVFVTDPVRHGLVRSYARPGGNVTGMTTEAGSTIIAKYVDLLKQAIPRLQRVALLWNTSSNVQAQYLKDFATPARTLGVELLTYGVREAGELEPAFARMAQERAGALIVLADPLFFANRERIAELALRYRIPAMSSVVGLVEAGGLMRYIADFYDLWRRSVRYVDEILRGADPAELAVEQPARFELVLNLRTARALGLTLPQSLLIRADRVIE
jgi:putative ABC transport system substrate-binding protein